MELETKAVVDSGLVVERPKEKSDRTKDARVAVKNIFSKLPMKTTKSKFSGRFGVANEARKAAQKLKISSSPPPIKERSITEETVPLFDEANYDVPLYEKSKPLCFSSSDSSEEESEDIGAEYVNDMNNASDTDDAGDTYKSFDLRICGKIFQQDLQDILLRNSCHTITLLDIASLEVSHSREQLATIKKTDRMFRTGWLHDEVINSFIVILERMFSGVLFCGSHEALHIAKGKSFRLLWKGVDLNGKKTLLIPFNPTNNHWILLHIDICSCTLYVLDPLNNGVDKNSTTFRKSYNVAVNALTKKFGAQNVQIGQMDHVMQKDGISCGVLVCYYAEQLARGLLTFLY